MLREDTIYPKEEGKAFPPVPNDVYPVELVDVDEVDNETYDSKTGKTNGVKQYEKNLNFTFAILAGGTPAEPLRGRIIFKKYVKAALYIGKNGKNDLYKITEAFLGRELTREEEASGISGKFLNGLIGKQIRVLTEQRIGKTDGKAFTGISNYLPVQTPLNSLTPDEKIEIMKATGKKDTHKAQEVSEINREIAGNYPPVNYEPAGDYPPAYNTTQGPNGIPLDQVKF